MRKHDYQTDPRLPENVFVVDDDYFLEHGITEDGVQGIGVTDTDPDLDPEITDVQYNFELRGGAIWKHVMTGIHRHGDGINTGHNACEQVPAHEQPAPKAITSIVAAFADAPVAVPESEAGDE